jgi:ATP-dependent Lon protease
VLAANRNGLKTVVLPERNKLDLEDLPDEVKKSMDFVFVQTMDDVLKASLESPRPAATGKPAPQQLAAPSKKSKADGKNRSRRR